MGQFMSTWVPFGYVEWLNSYDLDHMQLFVPCKDTGSSSEGPSYFDANQNTNKRVLEVGFN